MTSKANEGAEAVAVADLLASQGVYKESNSTMVSAVLQAAEQIISENEREKADVVGSSVELIPDRPVDFPPLF